MTQISTSVQETMEVVTLQPTALALPTALRAPVCQDTQETDSTAQVDKTIYKHLP